MNLEKLTIAIVSAGALLFVLEFVRRMILRALLKRYQMNDVAEVQFLSSFLINFVFCVMLPAVVYSALYPILPFTSYRSGFFIGLFVFGVGQLPIAVRSYNMYRLSSALTSFEILWSLLTILVTMGTITYLYAY